jgi:hypothetical protein
MATMSSLHVCPRCGSQRYQEEERRGSFRRECATCGHFHECASHLSDENSRDTWRLTTERLWERIGRLRKRLEDQGSWVVMDTWFCVPMPLPDGAVEWDTGATSSLRGVERSDASLSVVTREGVEAAITEATGVVNRAVIWMR